MIGPAYPYKHVSPKPGCSCAACAGWRAGCWKSLTSPQRRAIASLSRTVPRHLEDLAGVRLTTVRSLTNGRSGERPALIQQLDLRRPLYDARYYTFFVLTADGADLLATVSGNAPGELLNG